MTSITSNNAWDEHGGANGNGDGAGGNAMDMDVVGDGKGGGGGGERKVRPRALAVHASHGSLSPCLPSGRLVLSAADRRSINTFHSIVVSV